jgi:3-phenylpropionate/trans-cinnamate dioxygenase ferredoxin component
LPAPRSQEWLRSRQRRGRSVKNWIEVAGVAEFEKMDRKLVELSPDKQIGVFKVDGEFFAINAWCSHEKASLLIGDVADHEVMCSLHGARFDLRTGRHLSLPAVRPVASYPVRVEGGKVLVEI